VIVIGELSVKKTLTLRCQAKLGLEGLADAVKVFQGPTAPGTSA
jgi:hypothetical protein